MTARPPCCPDLFNRPLFPSNFISPTDAIKPVKYSFDIQEPSSDIEKHIVNLCAKKAAADLATQRGRDYGFGSNVDASMRATAIHKLDASLLEYLPTYNLDCERDLAVFDKLA